MWSRDSAHRDKVACVDGGIRVTDQDNIECVAVDLLDLGVVHNEVCTTVTMKLRNNAATCSLALMQTMQGISHSCAAAPG